VQRGLAALLPSTLTSVDRVSNETGNETPNCGNDWAPNVRKTRLISLVTRHRPGHRMTR
jgi:hypothetical protein